MPNHLANLVFVLKLLFAAMQPCCKDGSLDKCFVALREMSFTSHQVSILIYPGVKDTRLARIFLSGNEVSLILLQIGSFGVLADHDNQDPSVRALFNPSLKLRAN